MLCIAKPGMEEYFGLGSESPCERLLRELCLLGGGSDGPAGSCSFVMGFRLDVVELPKGGLWSREQRGGHARPFHPGSRLPFLLPSLPFPVGRGARLYLETRRESDSQWTLNLSSFYKRRDRERPKPSPARALYTAGVRSEHLASWAARAQGPLPCGFGTSWAGAHAGSAGSREAGGGKGPECAREAWEVLGFLIL